jgi:pyridoxine 5-phosphate synthase
MDLYALMRKVVKTLRDAEIEVSLFINPDLDQVRAAHKIDALRIELHTGRYAEARSAAEREVELARILDCVKAARKIFSAFPCSSVAALL